MHRPVPGTSAGLVDLIDKDTDIEVRHQVARAIGFGGFDDKVAGSSSSRSWKTSSCATTRRSRSSSAARTDSATRAVAMYADYPEGGARRAEGRLLPILRLLVRRGLLKRPPLPLGRHRRSASRASRVKRHAAGLDAAPVAGAVRQPRLRQRPALDDARRAPLPLHARREEGRQRTRRRRAIQTLKFMKEQGSLMALRDEPGETGAAREARRSSSS